MDMEQLNKILEDIKDRKMCTCPLKECSRPLILKPDREVNIVVITQGPNRFESEEFIASPANHPTYNYLNSLFSGKFSPMKEATAYWTHLRKCFLKDERGNLFTKEREDKILKTCGRAYLEDEIKAVQPEFILAVGEKVLEFLSRMSGDIRLQGSFEEVFKRQKDGLFDKVRTCESTYTLAIVPHPSGRSRFWIRPPEETKEILLKVQRMIFQILR